MYTVVLMAALAPGHASMGQNPAPVVCTCRGCWGCYGGYTGSGYNYMVASGYLSAFSTYAPVANAATGGVFGCNGNYGCYGGWSCYGVPRPGQGTSTNAPPAAAPGNSPPKAEQIPAPKENLSAPKIKAANDSNRAEMTINVPEGAKVFLDGEPMDLSTGKRSFQTPPLVPGRIYFYDLRVEVTRDGKAVTENQRIIVRAGQSVVAAFPNLTRDSVPVASK